MEVIRNTPADRPHIQRYRGGGFTVSGTRMTGPIIVAPTGVTAWTVVDFAAIDGAGLAAALASASVNLCIIGCGPRTLQIPTAVRQALKDVGISADAMETGAACRTYNMLVGEGRAVAAALIPLP